MLEREIHQAVVARAGHHAFEAAGDQLVEGDEYARRPADDGQRNTVRRRAAPSEGVTRDGGRRVESEAGWCSRFASAQWSV